LPIPKEYKPYPKGRHLKIGSKVQGLWDCGV